MINIFVSYSHRDQIWFVKDSQYDLIHWLQYALRRDNVRLWYDRSDESGLRPGDEFRQEIERQIDNAQITLLMLSEAFFSSDFIQKVEVPRIMALAERRQMVVIPILLEPCDWDDFDYVASRQMVPGKPTPLIKFTDKLSDWVSARMEILSAIRKRVEQTAREVEATTAVPPPLPPIEPPHAKAMKPAAVTASPISQSRWLIAGIVLTILAIVVGNWLTTLSLITATPTPTTFPIAMNQTAQTVTEAPTASLFTVTPTPLPSVTPSATVTVSATDTATATVSPTETATIQAVLPTAVTPTATPSLMPSSTPTPAPQGVVVIERANVRSGPGAEYPIIATYSQGTLLALTGRNRSSTWLVVRGPDRRAGWMAATTLRITGKADTLPEVAAPPTPTPTPTHRPTVTPVPASTLPSPTSAPPEPPTVTAVPPETPTPAPPETPTPAPP